MNDSDELPNLPSLGERLLWARNEKGWTQEKLSKMVNQDQTTIDKIENGITKQPRNIERLGQVLDVPPAWLQYAVPDLENLDRESIDLAIKFNSMDSEARKAVNVLVSQIVNK